MKYCNECILIFFSLTISLHGVSFAEEASTLSGFHGDLTLGGMWIHTDSQLVPHDDKRKISSIWDNGESESEFGALLMGNLSYTTASGTKFFISADEGASAGISQDFTGIANVTVAGIYQLDEVWEDPYLTGVEREDTDVVRAGGKICLDGILGSGLNLSYSYTNVEVDNDEIGKKNSLLVRNGDIHMIVSGYTIQLGAGNSLTPQIQYEIGDFDGESNSYNSMGIGLAHSFTNAHMVITNTVSLATAEYDRSHPVFDKIRDEDIYGISSSITWLNPLGYEDFSVTAMGSYYKTDSNIAFFESTDIMAGVGIGYRF
jgi:hypothetical protein